MMNRRTFIALLVAGAALMAQARAALARFRQGDIDAIRSDYLAGRVTVREGWIMAETEAALAARREAER